MNFKSMKPFIHRHSMSIGFATSFLFWLCIVSSLPIRYEMNDDLAYIIQVSGIDGFPALPFDIFLSQGLSSLLFYLYKWTTNIPWYGLVLSSAYIISGGLFISVLLRTSVGLLSSLLLLPAAICYFFSSIAFYSHTSATVWLAGAVYICLFEWLLREKAPISPRWYAIFLCFCFCFALLLRIKLALMFGIFALPIGLYLSRKMVRTSMPYLLCVLAVAILNANFPLQPVGAAKAKAFKQYNHYRSLFHDTSRGLYSPKMTPKALKLAGWSTNDYLFYRSWNLYDNQKFNASTLKRFLQKNTIISPRTIWKTFKASYLENRFPIHLFLWTIVALILIRSSFVWKLSRKTQLKIFLSMLVLIAGIVALMMYRFVQRFYFPLLGYIIMVFFLLLHVRPEVLEKTSVQDEQSSETEPTLGPAPKSSSFLLILLAGIMGCCAAYHSYAECRVIYTMLRNTEHKKEILRRTFLGVKKTLSKQKPKQRELWVQMSPIDGLGLECIHPLKEKSEFPPFRLLPSGTSVHSPRFDLILKQLGRKDGRDFLRWTIDRPSVHFVILTQGARHLRHFWSLWQGYYQRNIAPKKRVFFVKTHVFGLGGGREFVIFRAITKPLKKKN